MDEKFEKVAREFFEIEPLDFEPINSFYLKHKEYLKTVVLNDEYDIERYKDIISEIANTYAANEKYEYAIPLLKKAILLKKDVKLNYSWLGIAHFNLDKPIWAYYYYSKCGKDYPLEDFDKVLLIVKKKMLSKLYDIWIYIYLVLFSSLAVYKWFFGGIENYWLNIFYYILLAYSIIISLNYAYQYFKFKAKNK